MQEILKKKEIVGYFGCWLVAIETIVTLPSSKINIERITLHATAIGKCRFNRYVGLAMSQQRKTLADQNVVFCNFWKLGKTNS